MNKIYKIEFNDYIYYGSTKQQYLSRRQARHNHNLRHNPNQLLYRKANEEGIEKLVCELVCECEEHERLEMEDGLIVACDRQSLNERRATLTEEEKIQRKKESNQRYEKTEKGKYMKSLRDKRYYDKKKSCPNV